MIIWLNGTFGAGKTTTGALLTDPPGQPQLHSPDASRRLPQTEDVLLTGADHSLALMHTPQVADALADFLGRHAILTGGGLD